MVSIVFLDEKAGEDWAGDIEMLSNDGTIYGRISVVTENAKENACGSQLNLLRCLQGPCNLCLCSGNCLQLLSSGINNKDYYIAPQGAVWNILRRAQMVHLC